MGTSKAERLAILDLGRILHMQHTGRTLREGEYPCQDAMWQLQTVLDQSERALTDLLNDYRSTAG